MTINLKSEHLVCALGHKNARISTEQMLNANMQLKRATQRSNYPEEEQKIYCISNIGIIQAWQQS